MNNNKNISPKIWKIPAIAIGALLLLFALHNGLGRHLAKLINTRYELGQCAEVVRLVELGRRIYLPITTSAFSVASEHFTECEMYEFAFKAQQEGNWVDAYTFYADYMSNYPEGVMSTVAQENAAQTLLNLAKEEFETHQYAESVNHSTQFLEEYSTFPMASDAKALLPLCYLEWAKTLLKDQNFTEALDKFKLAMEADVHPDDPSGPSQQALTQIPSLYYQWANFLVDGSEFESALEKYKLAIETDSNPDDPSGPASQASTEIPVLYNKWADSLVSQGNFEQAVVQYQTYISMAPPKDQGVAKDALAKGYLHWAEALSNNGDFQDALDKINLTESTSSSEEIRSEIEKTRANTYTALATSSGSQAQQIMDEVARNLIEKKQMPELPVFGINSENVHVYVYGEGENVSGIQDRVSEDILPQTPGEMHYVAYVYESADVTGSCQYSYIDPLGWVVTDSYVLYTHHWVANLIDIDTGNPIEKRGFFGSSPHCTSKSRSDLFGEQPLVADLEVWLRTFIR